MNKSNAIPEIDVTVVIPTYNRAQYITYSIDSILAQNARPTRIVIIDDGSTDDTKSVLKSYQAEIEVFHKDNEGKARALNWLLPSITTEYVWFFDDDDVSLPQALNELAQPFHEDPELGFAFGDRYVSQAEGNLTTDDSVYRPYRFPDATEQEQRLQLYHECTIMMSSSLLRTRVVKEVGGFNEDLDRAQDYDLMVRLASRYRFRYCGKPVYILRRHPGVRGTLRSQHQSSTTHRLWAHYNRPIGFYIRYCISLRSLATNATAPLSSSADYREGLFTRAWILANKLPLRYAIEDIVEACGRAPETLLSNTEKARLLETLNHDFTVYQGHFSFCKTLGLIATPCGAKAAILLSKGFYWRGRNEASTLSRWSIYARAAFLYSLGSIGQQFHHFIILLYSFFSIRRS